MTSQLPLDIDGQLYGPGFGELASPVHWPSLTEEEHEGRTGELRDWVDQLVARFALDTRVIPPCWLRHNGMVETLSALRDHERASYADSAPATAAVDWVRALRDVESLLRDLAGKTQCTAQIHRPELPRATRPVKPAQTEAN